MCPAWGLLFQLKFLNRVEKLIRNSWTKLRNLSGIPEPSRIWQQFSSQQAFLASLCLISFSKNNFWLNQFIFNNKFSYQAVEIDQIIHNIMFFRSATLPTWRKFSQTRPKKTLKWKKIPKPGILFQQKFKNRLKAKGFRGPLPINYL